MHMIPFSVQTLAPSAQPVQLADVKSFLRVDVTDDDTLIGVLIDAVTSIVESHIDKKLITQKWVTFFDHLPYTDNKQWWDGTRDLAISELRSPQGFIDLPFGPCNSVDSFYTYDNADTQYPFDVTSGGGNVSIDTSGPFGRIALKIGAVWPVTVMRPIKGVEINATYGYGASYASVPAAIRQAINLGVAKLYENRGDDESGEFSRTSSFTLPETAVLLLAPFRRHKVGR